MVPSICRTLPTTWVDDSGPKLIQTNLIWEMREKMRERSGKNAVENAGENAGGNAG